MAHDLEQLKQDHPDVAKLFADDWLQYRKSEILPELTREAQSRATASIASTLKTPPKLSDCSANSCPRPARAWTSARQSGLITGWA